MIVMKFGGTSVQDAGVIEHVAAIVKSKINLRPIVVVSAMAKVTDTLLDAARAAEAGRQAEVKSRLNSLTERHLSTARELVARGPERERLEEYLKGLLDGLGDTLDRVLSRRELGDDLKDAISSFGERLSSSIIAAAFKERGIAAALVDARTVLATDDHFTAANPDVEATRENAARNLLPLVESGLVPITQGFVAATLSGVTTTLGRGGSDYSAAIIGSVLGVDAIEIWTDVDGLMTADPRVVPGARRIRVVSFEEAAELAYFGAKVLHPSTVLPAIERNIPVRIFNTKNPACEGTAILPEPKRSENVIKSIAVKRSVTIVNVASPRMILAHGFLRSIFEIFDRHKTSVDVVTTSEASVSMTLDNTERLERIIAELQTLSHVSVEPAKAIVCVVGDNLKFTPGVAARVFRALGDINVNMISQGASIINLTFVINESEAERAIRLLHDDFFRECDPSVFA